MLIRKMAHADIDDVVNLHTKAFPGFFLTCLGCRFLKAVYSSIVRDRSGISVVASKSSFLEGFVAGTDAPAGFYRRLMRSSWWRFGSAALWPILREPSLLPRLLNAFRRPGQASSSPDECELMSIAVAPEAEGGGVGGRLIEAFVEEARVRGKKFVVLTTDELGNDRVNAFYRARGFHVRRVITTAQGRRLNEYIRAVDKETGGDKTA